MMKKQSEHKSKQLTGLKTFLVSLNSAFDNLNNEMEDAIKQLRFDLNTPDLFQSMTTQDNFACSQQFTWNTCLLKTQDAMFEMLNRIKEKRN